MIIKVLFINVRIMFSTHPEAQLLSTKGLPQGQANISVDTKAKTAHSWQKLSLLKFYYGKSYFVFCSLHCDKNLMTNAS